MRERWAALKEGTRQVADDARVRLVLGKLGEGAVVERDRAPLPHQRGRGLFAPSRTRCAGAWSTATSTASTASASTSHRRRKVGASNIPEAPREARCPPRAMPVPPHAGTPTEMSTTVLPCVGGIVYLRDQDRPQNRRLEMCEGSHRLKKLTERTPDTELGGRLPHFADVLVPMGAAQARRSAERRVRGSGTAAEWELHAVYAVRGVPSTSSRAPAALAAATALAPSAGRRRAPESEASSTSSAESTRSHVCVPRFRAARLRPSRSAHDVTPR